MRLDEPIVFDEYQPCLLGLRVIAIKHDIESRRNGVQVEEVVSNSEVHVLSCAYDSSINMKIIIFEKEKSEIILFFMNQIL